MIQCPAARSAQHTSQYFPNFRPFSLKTTTTLNPNRRCSASVAAFGSTYTAQNDGCPYPSALQTTPHTSAFPTLTRPPQAHNKSRSPPLSHMPLLDEIVSSLRIPSRP